MPARSLKIDVVSDVICPWCLIGVKRLDDALATRPDVEAKVTFLPFLLDPSTPTEGADLRERLRAKFGDPRQMFARVESAARASGIPLDFEKIRRTPNTVGAHVLLGHAIDKGTQRAVKKALLDAYFLDGRDIGDPDVLASIGAANGFDLDTARACVIDDVERAKVRAEATAIGQRGISGVPFFIFADKLAVSGAQSIEVFQSVIDKSLSA